MRRSEGVAVKFNSVYKEEDSFVPRFELPNLLKKIKEVGGKYGFESVCYVRTGDGNLHVNIIKGNLKEYDWEERNKRNF
jgi:glycolate oxidase